MFIYYFELAGVAVFAASGVLAARDRDLDFLGLLVVAAITAIGGGTLRDLLLDRHPIFWVINIWYLVIIIAATILTIIYISIWPPPRKTLLVADTLGLALFALSGAQLAEAAQCPLIIVILMGTMTGVTGGILRDVITARIPLILQREIYATAAITGIIMYIALKTIGVPHGLAITTGMVTVVALRLLAIRWDWHSRIFRKY